MKLIFGFSNLFVWLIEVSLKFKTDHKKLSCPTIIVCVLKQKFVQLPNNRQLNPITFSGARRMGRALLACLQASCLTANSLTIGSPGRKGRVFSFRECVNIAWGTNNNRLNGHLSTVGRRWVDVAKAIDMWNLKKFAQQRAVVSWE